jgi:hypothetical protein
MREQMQTLVEELRSTGYFGRDQALAGMPSAWGTRIAALRQLEVIASQAAACWLDAEMSLRQTLEFIQTSFVPRMLALVEIIDQPIGQRPFATSLRELIARLSGDNDGSAVVSILVGAMVMRQFHEAVIAYYQRWEEVAWSQVFSAHSSNVAPEFFARCTSKLGWTPFDAKDGCPLVELAKRVDSGQRLQTAQGVSCEVPAS